MDKPIAVVTGATKGIGLAIAQALIEDGYKVLGTYVRSYEDSFIESLETDDFKLHQVDVANGSVCESFARSVLEEHKTISVLVNNAGIVKDGLMLRMSEADFTDVLNVNLVGTFNMVKAFSKAMMRSRSGSIVNIASVIGEVGNIGQANYAASKAGVIGFTKSIAKEFASRGLRVNCVAPGFIETEMTDALNEAHKEAILSSIALKTFGTKEDVANAVSFLVSDKARYITGQTLNVCGGMVM